MFFVSLLFIINKFLIRVITLQFLSNEIQRLEEAELDLNDLDDEESAYLRLDNLKRQHLAVWEQFCQLRGISRHAARLSRLPFLYNGASYSFTFHDILKLYNFSISLFTSI